MEIDLHSYVVEQLNAMGRGAWADLSRRSKVPQSTIQKIAYGVHLDPGVKTVQALFNTIINDRAPRADAPGAERARP